MIINLLVLLLWVPSVLGWGAAMRWLLASGIYNDQPVSDRNLGLVFTLGFLPLALIASALHFFVALTTEFAFGALIIGYCFLAYNRCSVRSALSTRSAVGAVWSVLLVSLFASRPLAHFDTGLYHIQSVKWCSTFPLVRGLANLHERLAFTSVWTPLSAFLDYPRFEFGACFPVTSLFLFGFGWASFTAILALKNPSTQVAEVFLAACGSFWASMVIANESLVILPSLSSDAPIYFTTLLCVYFLLRFSTRREYLDLFHALAFAALAVAVKVSAAPLLLFLLLFSSLVWMQDTKRFSMKLVMWCPIIATTGLLLIVWTLRSVWLSGYLVFPIPSTALTKLSWHLPVPMAEQLIETLKAWARWPGVSPEVVLSSSRWIPGWISRFCDENIFYTTLAVGVFGAVAMLLAHRLPAFKQIIRQIIPALLMVGTGIAYWLWTAPDPRYGYGYLFALACLTFSFGTALLLGTRVQHLRVVLCSITLVPLLSVSELDRFQLVGLPQRGSGPMAVRQTEAGVDIYVALGDQRILDGPLPSTPYFRPTLRSRFDIKGRFIQFDLPAAVNVPYYGIVPEHVPRGLPLATQ